MYRKVTGLKKLNPHLKVLLSVGRRDYDEARTTHYVNFLADKKAREAFIVDALNIVKKYGFDGIDLAWEFPRYKKNPLMRKIFFCHDVKKIILFEKFLLLKNLIPLFLIPKIYEKFALSSV